MAMRSRCFNPKHEAFKHYGGRGITVYPAWNESFDAFLADMGPRPPGTSLDRDNVNGHYEPGNVFWRTAKEQNRNRRNNHRLVYKGQEMCLTDAAEAAGLGWHVVLDRLRSGWDVERALSAPLKRGANVREIL